MKTETLRSIESLNNGSHSAIFLVKKIDISTSGYGKLDGDDNVFFVTFTVEEKKSFLIDTFHFIFVNAKFGRHDFIFRFGTYDLRFF